MLIKNGTLLDGTGTKMRLADIRIEGERIIEIGNLTPKNNEELVDAKDKYIAPGFIDILNHADVFAKLFENPSQESLLQQGITTVLMGNCGSSLAPLLDGVYINSIQKWGDINKLNVNWLTMKELFEEMNRHSFGVNIATLAGHSTMRRIFTEDEPRILVDSEIDQMEYMLEQALSEGAFGLSIGLAYAHARNANKRELIRMAKVVKDYNGLFSMHIRNESEGFTEGVLEGLNIAKKTGVNLEFSHLKVMGKKYWEQFEEGISALEDLDNVNFDIYPYTTTASVLYSYLPNWVSKHGNKSLFQVLKNKEKMEKLLEEMRNSSYNYEDMVVAMGNVNKIYFGKSLGEIAKNQGTGPEEIALNLIEASGNRVIVFNKTIDEENVLNAIKHPKSILCADGVGYKKQERITGEVVHPRFFGAFPKVLHEYVRKKEVLTWEEAIKKITSGPAAKIGLKNRGVIRENNYADVVILDPERIEDMATFKNPYQYPRGIDRVIINGETTVQDGKLQNTSGKILKRV
ncbi:MAG: amidohydrolase family protein [Candidatus Spechtbacterales bacterium]|nr:amidohydrolase family protein [Candidatus Spechtbacterales bacterium]